MRKPTYVIANGIQMTDACFYVVKVNKEEFGLVQSRAEALTLADRLADVLRHELSDDKLVEEGSMRIEKEIADGEIAITRQMLGRWVNGSKTRVYSITFHAVGEVLLDIECEEKKTESEQLYEPEPEQKREPEEDLPELEAAPASNEDRLDLEQIQYPVYEMTPQYCIPSEEPCFATIVERVPDQPIQVSRHFHAYDAQMDELLRELREALAGVSPSESEPSL